MKKAPEVTLDLDAMEREARLRIKQAIDYHALVASEYIKFRAKCMRVSLGITRARSRSVVMSPLFSHPYSA